MTFKQGYPIQTHTLSKVAQQQQQQHHQQQQKKEKKKRKETGM